MRLKKVKIVNFKCFEGEFNLELNDDLTILVGDNETGKTTILEAIHVALTGFFEGRYITSELTQYLFNANVVSKYLQSIREARPLEPPKILIEVYFSGDESEIMECWGDGNSTKDQETCGVAFEVALDVRYKDDYELLIKSEGVKSLPIEYYAVTWTSFARKSVTTRSIPIKSIMIDSSDSSYQGGTDAGVSRIIRDSLEPQDVVNVAQAHRRMRDAFMEDTSVRAINEKIARASHIVEQPLQLSVELLTKNAWENSLIAELDTVPFRFVGRGTQCIVKTELAISDTRAQKASVVLIEEPENHLSHANLNRVLGRLKDRLGDKQIIITTHSSFVANKLGLDKLVLINKRDQEHFTVRFDSVSRNTKRFFEKVAGYDTLRLILCGKAILVEGDSDELVVQKAFLLNNEGLLPIQKGIDVISVGTSFLRFLELADRLQKPTVVVADNDGSIEALEKKYEDYLGTNAKTFIRICYDHTVDEGEESSLNYNTLEPKLLKANSRALFNSVFSQSYASDDELLFYMRDHKTDCALDIFLSDADIEFPAYIMEAIREWPTD
jgi:putative ATP-dependent endonuclease of OLD family